MNMEMIAAETPYGRAADNLAGLGYHVIPISPGTKFPGQFTSGQWFGMREWQRYRDTPPTQFERKHWGARWPDAGIGLVLGTRVGGHQLIAVDIDTVHLDDFETLSRSLAASPMVKRGRKGETRFYLADLTFTSHSYVKEGKVVCDILTGEQTRQTVVPPTIHPDTEQPYVWMVGPVHIASLPTFSADDMTRYVEALESIGARRNRTVERSATSLRNHRSEEEENLWDETKREAMGRLSAWVPHLELYGARPARGGYEAVATWRASSTGRHLSERKHNLSIHPTGITDFGTGETYTPIDLVMRAFDCSQEYATTWLRARLGLTDEEPIVLQVVDDGEQDSEAVAPPPSISDELPARLAQTTGLVGALADWICTSARRPQPALALMSALVIVGVAAGRTYAGPTRSGTHLYALGLAPSGGGKEYPLRACTRILTLAGLNNRVGPGQFVSMPAVISTITRPPHCVVAAIDEFGSFLSRINNKRASSFEGAISGMLRSLWGINFESFATPEWAQRQSEIIQAPALSILGVSTHEEFYAALTGGDVVNGFLNRFLLLSTSRRPQDQDPDEDATQPPDFILADLKQIGATRPTSLLAHSGGPCDPAVRAQWGSAEAKDRWKQFARKLEAIEKHASFFARTAEIALRIATIKAIGDNPTEPRISLDDVVWACDVAEWSALKMLQQCEDYLADTEHQANAQRIIRIVKDAKGEISYRDIQRALNHRLKARDLKEILEGLVEAGDFEVRIARSAGGGHPQKYYSQASPSV